MTNLKKALSLRRIVVFALFATACFGGSDGDSHWGFARYPLDAYCTVAVEGWGTIDVETDYLPHVVACENGAASFEALRAQAVSARSYMFYRLEVSETIADGTSDQVYSCSRSPGPEHYDAVASTSGQVLVYRESVICAFYVAGAIPSSSDCVALPSDDDYSGTEHYVTYNEGRIGDEVEQTTLGWVHPDNFYNRGCASQNGADCLSDQGWSYDEILRFYYGDDIILETTVGDCIAPPEIDGDTPGDGDAGGDDHGDAESDHDVVDVDYDSAWIPKRPPDLEGGCTCRSAVSSTRSAWLFSFFQSL